MILSFLITRIKLQRYPQNRGIIAILNSKKRYEEGCFLSDLEIVEDIGVGDGWEVTLSFFK